MCFKVDCKQCGKHTWGGCGNHLATLYDSIESGKHCMCRSWPGVVIPAPQTATQQPSGASASTTTPSDNGTGTRTGTPCLTNSTQQREIVRRFGCWPVGAVLDSWWAYT